MSNDSQTTEGSFLITEPIPTKPMPGYKTTEFWMTLGVNIISSTMAFIGEIDATWAVVVMGILNALYILLRSTLKSHQVTAASTSIIE